MKWPMRWSGDLAARPAEVEQTEVNVGVGSAHLKAHVLRPVAPLAAVICAHPGATHELPPHEYELAHMLGAAGFATMLVGLATPEEHQLRMHLDVPLLAERLITLTRWLSASGASAQLPLGYLGVGDAAASALVATAMDPHQVLALVARSSRPERAGMSLMLTRAPTLFIVGEDQSVDGGQPRGVSARPPRAPRGGAFGTGRSGRGAPRAGAERRVVRPLAQSPPDERVGRWRHALAARGVRVGRTLLRVLAPPRGTFPPVDGRSVPQL